MQKYMYDEIIWFLFIEQFLRSHVSIYEIDLYHITTEHKYIYIQIL